MTKASIERFYIEMRTLAAQINIPETFIPKCERNGGHGWYVDMSKDGTEYVLSASEKGVPYDVFRSIDVAEFMEVVFVDMTERLAHHEVLDRYPPMSAWRSLWSMFERPKNSIKQRREIQILQESLLARLDPAWSERCAIKNAMGLRREIDFYFGIQ
ncbi:hypothetical protein OVA03_07270 [Asticcacaulis sp. SL142]|uniref:hypothetical protein n=1 Tax=Asticcacaulis sp. SL142 TaxID=2995155 RepID=UPI00226C8819|nr:hypothetical protein [Asticcacaulis sp. SL142]WAC49692.1 hypothetical protein OVA03_07270 [Asticcacaulis sp. SL142]